ncbi:MAG: 50S ribosomal protein L18 [bacterium]
MKSQHTLYSKQSRFERRKHRVNTQVKAGSSQPRLIVWKSNLYTSGQIVDISGKVIAYANDKNLKGTKTERAFAVGKTLAELAKKQGVETVVFDRNGNRYHGRVKSLSEGAREGGLKN